LTIFRFQLKVADMNNIKFTTLKHLLALISLLAVCIPTSAQTLTWQTRKADAMAAAKAQGKFVLLLAGRDTCSNCKKMKGTVAESINPPIRDLINAHFVPWYCNIDVAPKSDWTGYAIASFSLPMICVIDPDKPDVYLDRSFGVMEAPQFYARLQGFETILAARPSITGFDPAAAPVGATVRILGSNLVAATNVLFNGTTATFTTNAGLQAVVPVGATTGNVTVKTPAGDAVSTDSFTVIPMQITGFDPPEGTVGTTVSISGNNLINVTAVMFNGTTATFTTTAGLQAVVPAGATTGPITVRTSAGETTSSSAFTVIVVPKVDVQVLLQPGQLLVANDRIRAAFSIVLTNRGPDTATGILVTNSFAMGTNFNESIWPVLTNLAIYSIGPGLQGVSFSQGVLVWQVHSIASGAKTVLDLVVGDLPSGRLNLRAVATATEQDQDPANNIATTFVDVPSAPELAIVNSNQQVEVNWQAEDPHWVLQTAAQLSPNSEDWKKVEQAPVKLNETYSIALTNANAAASFYRLLFLPAQQ
jgi:hypothetical protein